MHATHAGPCYQLPSLENTGNDSDADAPLTGRSKKTVGELAKYANLAFPAARAAKPKPAAAQPKRKASGEVDLEEPAEDAIEEVPLPGKRMKMSTAVKTVALPTTAQRSHDKPSAAAAAAEGLAAFPEVVRDFMAGTGHTEVLPVQAHCWPPLLAGRDVEAVAPPGSGKTLGYLLPAAALLARGGHSGDTRPPGPVVLVLLPTRELAQQVAGVCKGLRRHCGGLRCACLTGGAPKEPQVAALARGPHIVVATPGRLIDLEEEGHVVLGK